MEEDKPGGPRKLHEQDETALRELLRQYPSHPARVLSELTKKTGKSISRHTLRRYARRFRLSWKRFHRSRSKKRDEGEWFGVDAGTSDLKDSDIRHEVSVFLTLKSPNAAKPLSTEVTIIQERQKDIALLSLVSAGAIEVDREPHADRLDFAVRVDLDGHDAKRGRGAYV